MPDDVLNKLDPALRASLKWIESSGAAGMLIGGAAAGLLSKPRATKDVDWVVDVPDDRLELFIKAAVPQQIESRISNPLEFARVNCILPFRHRPTGTGVDVALALSPFEMASLERRTLLNYKDLKIPLPDPSDLIVMKAVANRGVDQGDIERLLTYNKVNVVHIQKWVKEYSRLMQNREIVDALDNTLRKMGLLKKQIKPNSTSKKKRGRHA